VSGFCSMFSQLLKLFPRTEFQGLVTRTHAERHARGFTCWGQFVAMLFYQLGRAHSLREICGGLRSSEGKLKHLGITAPSRSTLAYANEHRPWQLYRAVFEALLLRGQPLAKGRRKFRFKNKLVSLDSTVIDLCASLFDWAQFRRTKGAVKLHCLLDHDGYLPSLVVITEGKRHDVRVARTLRVAPGTIVVMDRGYTDYAWFGHLTTQGGLVRDPPEGRRRLRGGRGPPPPGPGPRGTGSSHPPDGRGRGRKMSGPAPSDRGVRPGEG